ncbi:MAG: hypothetical protein WDN25_24510 [Acetobacteraceae bacterium]
MQRIVFTCLCLALTGCGFKTWSDLPFTTGSNPNRPAGDSENMRRVMGDQIEVPALTPEPGDIWPGPLPPATTLQDLERDGLTPEPQRPVPGSPDYRYQPPNLPPPPATRGSSTPPGSTQPGLTPLPRPTAPPQADTTPPARSPGGQVVPGQQGPGVTSGGTSGYQTLTTPGGGSAIVVPNGNGTSTIIHSDGRIETVPTPR